MLLYLHGNKTGSIQRKALLNEVGLIWFWFVCVLLLLGFIVKPFPHIFMFVLQGVASKNDKISVFNIMGSSGVPEWWSSVSHYTADLPSGISVLPNKQLSDFCKNVAQRGNIACPCGPPSVAADSSIIAYGCDWLDHTGILNTDT